MKNDNSFTLTAGIIIAGVVLAFTSPAEATKSTGSEAAAAPTSNNLHNIVAAIAAVDAPSATVDARPKGLCRGKHRAARHAAVVASVSS